MIPSSCTISKQQQHKCIENTWPPHGVILEHIFAFLKPWLTLSLHSPFSLGRNRVPNPQTLSRVCHNRREQTKSWLCFLHGFAVATCFTWWYLCLQVRGSFNSTVTLLKLDCTWLVSVKGKRSVFDCATHTYTHTHKHSHSHTLTHISRSSIPLTDQFQENQVLKFI